MNLPCFVLPYQRSPSWWNTPLSVLTHTIPFAGGTRASVVLDLAASVLLPPADVAVLSTLSAAGFFPWATGAGAGGVPETDTSGEILSIVFLDTPALERSSTAEYGRPAMIFLAVASPTPGSFSSSFWVAVLRSILAVAAALLADCAHGTAGFSQPAATSSARLMTRTRDMAASLSNVRGSPTCSRSSWRPSGSTR